VEVNRSVAVLDGAVLVVDSVAGVQAQTQTVWRAMTQSSPSNQHPRSNYDDDDELDGDSVAPTHEPLPCIAVVNKMDKIGNNFMLALKSLRTKLLGANPIPLQIPLFRVKPSIDHTNPLPDLIVQAWSNETTDTGDSLSSTGEFVGVVDLIHMRAVIWPDVPSHAVTNVEVCAPTVIPLLDENRQPRQSACAVTQIALESRAEMIAALANVDEDIEEYYLLEEEPSNSEIREAFRRATLSHKALPVLTAAALRGKGVEPCLDAIADFLPSPLDRQPPSLTYSNPSMGLNDMELVTGHKDEVTMGHPLHPSALAFAFKVLHMKGRGGSGDGRVVFARVYSGSLKDRDTIHVITPPPIGELPEKPRLERIGGMLEMAGGKFDKIQDGVCRSGEVCALVGLKTVVTGDTIVLTPERGAKKKQNQKSIFLAGVAAPRPVLTVRLETETVSDQSRLAEALRLLSVEDPSIVVEETESGTLLSGLGELHIEIVLDRLHREFNIPVIVGTPSVAYRETLERPIDSNGLINYDKTFGDTRLEASVHLILEPVKDAIEYSMSMVLHEPKIVIEQTARQYLNLDLDASEEDLVIKSDMAEALVQGCMGALKRGPLGPYPMSNVVCRIIDVDSEEGVAGLEALPGALRAASANIVSSLLRTNKDVCTILEPTMNIEISLPNDMVGPVLSDLTGRRGNVGDVYVGDATGVVQSKALIRGEVPLIEILGYANSLRSLTAGEASFTAEYKGHAPHKVLE
jgi:elongation factor G